MFWPYLWTFDVEAADKPFAQPECGSSSRPGVRIGWLRRRGDLDLVADGCCGVPLPIGMIRKQTVPPPRLATLSLALSRRT
jgi:hypothetical protein